MNLQRRSLSHELFDALRRGVRRLSQEGRERIVGYVRSQQTSQSAFLNRAGREDLYYTFFGWLLCAVLGIKSKTPDREAYLASIQPDMLDDFHRLVYAQAQELHRLLRFGFLRYSLRWISRGMPDEVPSLFQAYVRRSPDSKSVNMLSAQLIVKGLENGFALPDVKEEVGYLHRLQDDSGGWRQNAGTGIPDLLSTAVALFTLGQYGKQPCYDARYFVEAHWQEDGSFAPNLYDAQSDVEYVFYGLLALGAIRE